MMWLEELVVGSAAFSVRTKMPLVHELAGGHYLACLVRLWLVVPVVALLLVVLEVVVPLVDLPSLVTFPLLVKAGPRSIQDRQRVPKHLTGNGFFAIKQSTAE